MIGACRARAASAGVPAIVARTAGVEAWTSGGL